MPQPDVIGSSPFREDPAFVVGGVRCPSAQYVSGILEAVDRVYSKDLSLAVFPLPNITELSPLKCSWAHRLPACGVEARAFQWNDQVDPMISFFDKCAQGSVRHGICDRAEGDELLERIKQFFSFASVAAGTVEPVLANAHAIFGSGKGPTPWLHVDGAGYRAGNITYLVIGTTLVSDLLCDESGRSPEVTGRGMVFVPDELAPRAAIIAMVDNRLDYEGKLSKERLRSPEVRSEIFRIVDAEVKAKYRGRSPEQYLGEVPPGFGYCFRGGDLDGLVHGSPVLQDLARLPNIDYKTWERTPQQAGLLRRVAVTLDSIIYRSQTLLPNTSSF